MKWRFREWRARVGIRTAKWIAWRLPHSVVQWAYVRVLANATTGEHSSTLVPKLSAIDALQRW